MIGRRLSCVGIVFVFAFLFAGIALSGPEEALKFYVGHDFDQAIKACEGSKDNLSKLVLAMAHTEKYNIYKNKQDKDQAKMWLGLLKVDLSFQDALEVEKILAIDGNPNGNKEAEKLLDVCFDKATSTPDDIMLIVAFLKPEKGTEANEIALDAIYKRLRPVRDYVSKGGTMPQEMQDGVFSKDEVIEALAGALVEKKTCSKAEKCLVLIEEPALEHLEAQEMNKGISDAIIGIKKAIANRLKKFPNSTWFSASGK